MTLLGKHPLDHEYTSADLATTGTERRMLEDRHPIAALGAIVGEASALLFVGWMSDQLYHALLLGQEGSSTAWRISISVTLVFVALQAAGGEYRLARMLSRPIDWMRLLRDWIVAVAFVVIIAFMLKASGSISRGAMVAFTVTGLASVAAIRTVMMLVLKQSVKVQKFTARRVILIGERDAIERYYSEQKLWRKGIAVAASITIDRSGSMPSFDIWLADSQRLLPLPSYADLINAMRPLGADDVVLVMPWSARDEIDTLLRHLVLLPAGIHLAPDPTFDHLAHSIVGRTSLSSALVDSDVGISGIRILRRPIPATSRLAKRMFDIVGSAAGLVLLSPVLVAIAIAIRIESPGAPLFRQKRNGFNERPFTIYKFRSMRSRADEPFTQTKRDDDRVTRIGAFLRRTNLDEVPQLINVLMGDMSLVGPRPHALEHNSAFTNVIADFARRHHVKPGITGWAQVNGWRGAADDETHMSARIAHDLEYINNWSIWLDVKILVLTVFSRKAFHNAY